MPEVTTFTLPLHCPQCGGAVTLQMSGWPTAINNGETPVDAAHPGLQKATWTCPYCDRENEGGFVGRIAWARTGHAPDVAT